MRWVRIFLVLPLCCLAVPAWSAWFDTNYDYKRRITIDHTRVPNTDQTDFPVLLTEANMDAAFFSHVAKTTPANIDIIFTNAAENTELNREVVRFNPAGSSSIPGSFQAWVKVPTVATGSDTVIYMYYGYAAANRPNDTSTWSNGFVGVWHVEETGGNAQDSTANNNDASMQGNLPNAQVGSVGYGQTLDGAGDYLNPGKPGIFDITGANPITIETWVRFSTLNAWGYQDYFTKGDHQYSLQKPGAGNNNLQMIIYDGYWQVAYSNAEVTTNTWYHTVGRYTSSNREVALFMNGLKQTAVGSATQISNTRNDDVNFGRNSETNNRYLTGSLDEIRICNVARSDDWIRTTYNNQSAPQTFCSVGGEEWPITPTPSNTRTETPTATPTRTPTHSPTVTRSATYTLTPTETRTATPTRTYTNTPTITATPTITRTATETPTITVTRTTTPTLTPSQTNTVTVTPTFTITRTPTITPTRTITPSATISATITRSPTVSPSPTNTLTVVPVVNLSEVVVYPNLYNAEVNTRSEVVFGRLPPRTTVRIYALTGELVRTIEKPAAGTTAVWDLRNAQGSPAASGVYLYVVDSEFGKLRGKVVLKR